MSQWREDMDALVYLRGAERWDERNRRIGLEETIIRALDESRDEGYGDCPHGGEGEPCTWCDAHWTADALIKGNWIVGGADHA